MLTRWDIPKLLLAWIRTEFQKWYDLVTNIYDKVCTTIISTKAEEVYAWLWDTPKMRKWLDEKVPKALKEYDFSVKNTDYEATIWINRNALKDEQYNQIKIRVNWLWVSAKKWYDEALTELIQSWHTSACYDWQNFFDTDHSEGASWVQSNYIANGWALSSEIVKEIVTKMQQYKTDTWSYIWINPTHIMVPTSLSFLAKELFDPLIVNVSTDPSKASLKWLLEVIVNPYLDNSLTPWNSPFYILDLSQWIKPFIFQNREAIKLVSQDKDTDTESFMRKTLYYSAEARYAFWFGDWKYAFKSQW